MFCLVLVCVTNEYSSVCVLATLGPLYVTSSAVSGVLCTRIHSDGMASMRVNTPWPESKKRVIFVNFCHTKPATKSLKNEFQSLVVLAL